MTECTAAQACQIQMGAPTVWNLIAPKELEEARARANNLCCGVKWRACVTQMRQSLLRSTSLDAGMLSRPGHRTPKIKRNMMKQGSGQT
jgi:hypothetical protein